MEEIYNKNDYRMQYRGRNLDEWSGRKYKKDKKVEGRYIRYFIII